MRSPEFSVGPSREIASAEERSQDAIFALRGALAESAENGEQKLEWFREREGKALPFHPSNSGDGAAALGFRHRNNRRLDTN